MKRMQWRGVVVLTVCLASVHRASGQTVYNWNNGSGGFWSGANWTPSTPPAGGGQDIRLIFGVSGTYTANNDLSGTFQLNQPVEPTPVQWRNAHPHW